MTNAHILLLNYSDSVMRHTDNPNYPDFELIEIEHVHLDEPALVQLLEELGEDPDRSYKIYRADIYSNRPFASQPEFTVEIVYVPDENRCAIEWVDGMEWLECDTVDDAVQQWVDHHMDI